MGDSFTQQIKFTEGRYQVRLPWKPTHRPLPDNLELCEKRLAGLLKKLKTTPQLLVEYDKVIKDQLEKGVVEIAPAQESLNHDEVHYLPHHAVVRKDRATTKIRVVYDASARNHRSMIAFTLGPPLDSLFLISSSDSDVTQWLWRRT